MGVPGRSLVHLWFFLFFVWIWLVISIFADIIRARDMSGWAKAFGTIGIIILPFLGVFLYLIVNGGNMSRRAQDDAIEQEKAVQASHPRCREGPVHRRAGQAGRAPRSAGKLSDDEG